MRLLRLTLRHMAAPLAVFAAFLAPVFLIAVAPAGAVVSTPFDNLSVDGAWRVTQGTNWIAQSFSTGAAGLRLTNVGVRLRNANEANNSAVSGTYSVSVWSSNGVSPTSQLGTITSSQSLAGWGEDATVRTASAAVNLDPNSRYFVVVAGSSGSTVGWKCNNTTAVTTDVSPTPTFANYTSSNSGSSWSALSGTCSGQNFIMKVTGTVRTTPTLSNFSNVSATLGDPVATITEPTTAVAGTFTYSSSDTSVAAVSGGQLTFAGVGSATITATFTPTDADNYTTATIAMTVSVAASTTTAPTTSSTTTSTSTTTTSTSTTTSTTTTTVPPSSTTSTMIAPSPTRPPRTTTSTIAPSPAAVAPRSTTTSLAASTTSAPATTTSSTTAPSTTTSSTTTQPPKPAGSDAAPAAPSDNIFSDSEARQAVMRIEASPGIAVGSGVVTVRAAGLRPGSTVTVTVFSEPRVLLQTTVDDLGSLDTSVALPPDLGPGRHTVVLTASSESGDVNVVGALSVSDEGVIEGVVQPAAIANFDGPNDARLERAVELGKPIYDPASRPRTTASVVVAATGLIALAGAAGMAGSGLPSSSASRMAARGASDEGQRRRNSRGKLAGAVTKKLKGLQIDGEARGDAGRTWQLPGTSRADSISSTLPNSVGKWSSLAPRIVVDGSWLRAMFGSFGWLSWAAGLILGLVGAFLDTRSPLTPAFGMILVIAALGILDAGGGAVAWLTLVFIAALGGDVSGWPDVRTALGLGLVFASVPLLAHVIRPLRRFLRGNSFERWERLFDYAMMPVFVAFATGSMLKALNGLSGLELVTPAQVSTMRWLVAIGIIVRLALEDVASHHYPRRMAEVQPKKLVSPSRRVTSVSIVLRSFIFLMVAEPFFGLNVRTVVAAVLLAIPLVLKMWEDDLPNSTAINKWLPRGLFRFLCTLVLGAYLTSTLIGRNGGDAAIRSSFIWMLIPGVTLGVIELFGRSGGEWSNVALKRSLGALVWLVAAGIVTGRIVIFR